MADDNVLGIQATINGEDIQKGAGEFIGKITEMERAADRMINSLADGFRFLDKQLRQLSGSLESNRQKLDCIFSQMQSFRPSNSISAETYAKLQDEYAKAMSMQQELESRLEKTTSEVNEQKRAYSSLTEKIRENGKEAVTAAQPKGDSSTINIKSLKEQMKALGTEIKNSEKLYESQAQKLGEYEARIARYQNALAKGMTRIGTGGAKSELVAPALEKATQEYEALRQKQASVVEEIDKQKQKQQELNIQLEQTTPKAVRFRTELMNIKQQMMEMRRNGQANTEEFARLQQKAAELQRTMNATNKQTQLMASPKLGFQATREGITLLTGSLTGLTAVMSMFNSKSEDVAKMQKRLQEVMAITMAVQQLFSVSLATSALRTYALGKAKLFLTTTTNNLRAAFVSMGLSATGASIAVTALYAALTLGISAAITAIVTAISAWVSKSRELSKAQEEQRQRLEEEQKLRKNAASSISEQMAGYKKLQSQYKALGNSIDKQKKFIKDNRSEFQKLGVSVRDVNDAENLFIRNEAAFIASLKHRAMAAAAMAQMQEQYKAVIDKMIEMDDYAKSGGSQESRSLARKHADEYIVALLRQKGVISPKYKTEDVETMLQLIRSGKEKGNKELQGRGIDWNKEYNAFYQNQLVMLAGADAADKFNRETEEARKNIDRLAETVRKETESEKRIKKDAGIDDYDKDADKREKSTKKEAEKLRKQQEKLSEELLSLRRKNQQDEINLMEDGTERKLKQIDLDYQKELDAIEAARENAQKDKTYNLQSPLLDKAEENAFKKYQKAISDVDKEILEAQSEAMNRYLKEYGTFQQKKEAIAQEYAGKIAKAATEGSKKILQKEMEEAIQSIDLSELKQSMDWEQVFGSLDKVSTDTLKRLKSNLKDFVSSQKDLSPENFKEMVDAIERINEKVSGRKPFESMSVSLKSLKDATDEQRKAQEAYNKALEEGTSEEKKNAKATLESAKNNKQKALSEATTALHKGVDEIGQYVDAGNQVIGIMGTLGVKTPEWLEGTMSGFGEMLNGLGNIDLTRPISIVTGSLQTIKGALTSVVSLGGLIPGFGGADYSRYNEMVEEYTRLNEIWDELIDKKREYIGISYGAEADKAGQEALGLVEKQIEAYRLLGKERLNSGASIGSHSIGKRMAKNTSSNDWQDIADALDMSVSAAKEFIGTGRMTGLFDLTAGQLERLKSEAPTFWAKMDSEVQEYLNGIIEGEERIGDIQNQISEQLTQTTFDRVFDNFIDTLMNMKASSKDAAKDISEYFMRAMLSNQIGTLYQDKLKMWYEKFSEKMKDGSLDEREREALHNEYMGYIEEAMKLRNELAAATGYDKTSQESTSQSSTKRGFGTEMTHEDAGELSGRFTALQITGEEIKNQNIIRSGLLKAIAVDTGDISRRMAEQNGYISEILDIQNESVGHLSEISKNTRQLYQMNERLGKIEENTKGLTRR